MKRPVIIGMATVLALMLLSACSGNKEQPAQITPATSALPAPVEAALTPTPVPVQPTPATLTTGIQSGNVAPDFQLKNLNGESVSLSDFRGQAVWINFWATW